MKYAILIGDGMSDYPLKELGDKTPLEAAKTPNMDSIAMNGLTGFVKNVPKGFKPGSDIANLSIFGYDPAKYFTGRGPLEAAYMGVKLKPSDVAFRCNVVTIKDGIMADFTAGHISNGEAEELIKFIDKELGSKEVRFYPGVSYRHLTVIENGPADAECTPPHDITDKKIDQYLPKGKNSEILNKLMSESVPLLADHEVNKKRISSGKNPANMIWLWGQGRVPQMPSFKQKYGLTGSVITAVNLLKGIGVCIGLDVINVPGATGYFDTNYKGKAEYALDSLKNHDVVFVHLESPDEAGHMGDIKAKVKAIEDFDNLVVGTVLKGIKKFGDYRVIVLPDHPTPISIKTHSADPVPFAMCGGGVKQDSVSHYNEKEVSRSKLSIDSGHELLGFLFKR